MSVPDAGREPDNSTLGFKDPTPQTRSHTLLDRIVSWRQVALQLLSGVVLYSDRKEVYMARRLRLPLVLLLATLVGVLVLTPSPASAVVSGPTCYGQAGHYYDFAWVDGYQSSMCGGVQWCHIGRQYFEWDCVLQGGSYVPANVVAYSPSWCTCNSGAGWKKCC